MNSNDIKQQTAQNGAILCGIAPISRFTSFPHGFSPVDLFPATQSVIAFAKQIPESLLHLSNTIPYSVSDEVALFETHRIGIELSLYLEKQGFRGILVPSEPYEYWDAENKTGKGLLSLKHTAYECGLGVFGKNHLLYNPAIGNLMKIGAVLTDAILEPDPVLQAILCNPHCRQCQKQCPAGAINDTGVNQLKCRNFSEKETAKGYPIISCNKCRSVCPHVNGFPVGFKLPINRREIC